MWPFLGEDDIRYELEMELRESNDDNAVSRSSFCVSTSQCKFSGCLPVVQTFQRSRSLIFF